MNVLKTAVLTFGMLLICSAAAMAQGPLYPDAETAKAAQTGLSAIGCGLVIIGAGVGIGWLTRSAVESMARQPEVEGRIFTTMIISAALIEGVTFFALILVGFIL